MSEKGSQVLEVISDEAGEISRLPGIEPYLNRVRTIARNSSTGEEDAITLEFYKDFAEKSLIWSAVKQESGKIVMNGIILWSEEDKNWSIHT